MALMELVQECYAEIAHLRECVHRYPELGHREFRTTALIRDILLRYGVPILEYGLETGVVACIRGGRPGKCLAIREDIDALPLQENTGLPFASEIAGVSHACGHDIHAAALLGCAKLLARHQEMLHGTVLLIFQCAEETMDGAAGMLKKEIFREGTPDAIIGFHCAPALPLGTIGVLAGAYNASCDGITLTVTGKGGHGAHPDLCVDPIVLSAGLITQLQTIVSRNKCPTVPMVLTFGEIHGGSAPNIIPDTVTLRGSLRTFDASARAEHLAQIEQSCKSFCQAFRGSCHVLVEKGMPPLINSADICQQMIHSGTAVLGAGAIITDLPPSMGSDDFSCLLEACGNHGAQFLLGTGMESLPASRLGLHVAENIFPSQALVPGVAVLTQFAFDYLGA